MSNSTIKRFRFSIIETEEDTDTLVETMVKDLTKPNHAIVVYNHDVNSFDHVIWCFMKYCEHSPDQAHQCALIIHNNGKYAVKHGDYAKLKPICEALLENYINAKIEE